MDKFRILIVEDNGLFRQTLRESLQISFPGVAIDEATNGDEALEGIYESAGKLLFDMGPTVSLPKNLSIGCGLKNW